MEGLAGHGALPSTAVMPVADLLGPAAGTVMQPEATTGSREEDYFVLVQQLVYITGGAAAPAAAAGISMPTSVAQEEPSVDVTSGSNPNDGLAASHAVVVDAGVENLRGQNGPSSRGGRRSRRPRRRSVVWEHMELDPSGNRATCRYCTKTLSAKTKGGTTHLRRHVNRCALRELARAMDV